MREPKIGTRHAMNMAARTTPTSVCDWIDGRRADRRWRPGFARTSSGQRKAFHDTHTADPDATPRMGDDVDVERNEQDDGRNEERREQQSLDQSRVPRSQHRQDEAARGRDDELGQPGAKSDDDGVPEVPGDVHVRPRLTEVAPCEAVWE